MRAISIRQPWAGAVVLGWKPVENRSRMFQHRDLVLIHAGGAFTPDYTGAEAVINAAGYEVPVSGLPRQSPAWAMGAVVGVADLYAAHKGCDGSCAPGWAQPGQVHHMIRDARPLRWAVPCPGRLGIWTPDPSVLQAVKEAMPS